MAAPGGLLAPLGDDVLGGGVTMTGCAACGATGAGTGAGPANAGPGVATGAGGGTGGTPCWFSSTAMSPAPDVPETGAGAARRFNQAADQPSSAARAKTDASVATRGSFWITVALNCEAPMPVTILKVITCSH